MQLKFHSSANKVVQPDVPRKSWPPTSPILSNNAWSREADGSRPLQALRYTKHRVLGGLGSGFERMNFKHETSRIAHLFGDNEFQQKNHGEKQKIHFRDARFCELPNTHARRLVKRCHCHGSFPELYQRLSKRSHLQKKNRDSQNWYQHKRLILLHHLRKKTEKYCLVTFERIKSGGS